MKRVDPSDYAMPLESRSPAEKRKPGRPPAVHEPEPWKEPNRAYSDDPAIRYARRLAGVRADAQVKANQTWRKQVIVWDGSVFSVVADGDEGARRVIEVVLPVRSF